MAKQYYFASKDDELCYEKSHFEDLMKEEGLSEMTLFKAQKQEGIDDFFWCKYYSLVGAKSEGTCGKNCGEYSPKNGVSGCCKHYSTKFYEASDETITIKT